MRRMTLQEYDLHIKAYQLKEMDKQVAGVRAEILKRATNATEKLGDKVMYRYASADEVISKYLKPDVLEARIFKDDKEADEVFKRLIKIKSNLDELRNIRSQQNGN